MEKDLNTITEITPSMGSCKKYLIKNFKNIGFKETSEFLLSASFNHSKQGGLVIVIGENNCGKSNVLDALLAFDYKYRFDKLDVNNSFKSDTSKIELTAKITINGKTKNVSRPIQTQDYDLDILGTDYTGYDINSWLYYLKKIPDAEYYERNKYKKLNKKLVEFSKEVFNEFKKYDSNDYSYRYGSSSQEKITKKEMYEKISKHITILNEYEPACKDEIEKFHEYNSKIFKIIKKEQEPWNLDHFYKLDVFKYEENKEVDKLRINHNEIKNNAFFISLFDLLDYNYKEISSLFEQSEELDTTGNIDYEIEELNKKLETVADDFNKLYSFDTQKYSFKIDLDKEKITFNIFKNKSPIALKQQSVGFKCFFQLYFKVIKNKKFKPGTVVVIDEPGIHLHPKGQEELGHFFRKFGKENNILFVISTHSPFIVDLDRLDEIRIVELEENGQNAIINNYFTFDTRTKDQTNDPLFQIKKNLTIGENVLLKPKTKIVFVEGITDYNYLTAFKNYFNDEKYNNIYFVPIAGVDLKDNMKEKYENVSRLFNDYNTYALVDGDENGLLFQTCANENKIFDRPKLNVWTLKDINKDFTTIESLFDEEDKKDEIINCILSKKSFSWSSAFKNYYDINKLTSKTIENFKTIFEGLVTKTK